MDPVALFDVLSTTTFMGERALIWVGFLSIVLVLLAIDLGLMNRRDEIISARKSLYFAAFYASLAVIFGIWMWQTRGPDDATDYFTAYLIEMSLSLDNLFVMSVVLTYFAVPRQYQHRVLFWGIMGVLIMRAVMIGFGSILIENFS